MGFCERYHTALAEQVGNIIFALLQTAPTVCLPPRLATVTARLPVVASGERIHANRGQNIGAVRGTRLQEARNWLVAAVDALPEVVLPVERQRFLQEVLEANSRTNPRASVAYSLRELARLCRVRRADEDDQQAD